MKPTDPRYDERVIVTDSDGKDASAAMERQIGFRTGKYKVPKPRPAEIEEKAKKRKGVTSRDQRELDALIGSTVPNYKDGGLIDRKAIRGKTRGKMC